MHWGETGHKYYIILRGAVRVLIPNPKLKNSKEQMQDCYDDLVRYRKELSQLEALIKMKESAPPEEECGGGEEHEAHGDADHHHHHHDEAAEQGHSPDHAHGHGHAHAKPPNLFGYSSEQSFARVDKDS